MIPFTTTEPHPFRVTPKGSMRSDSFETYASAYHSPTRSRIYQAMTAVI